MAATYAYSRPTEHLGATVEIRRQQEACRHFASLYALKITTQEGGGWIEEQSPLDRHRFEVLMTKLQPNDTVIVAEPGVLGASPSELLATVSRLIASGVRVLVVSLAGEINLPVLRAYVTPMLKLETALAKEKSERVQDVEKFQADLDDFQSRYEKSILSALSARGINLVSLLRPEDAGEVAPKDIATAQSLLKMRVDLDLTQEEAGALVAPNLSKATVSRLENEGRGAKLGEYRTALILETHKRKKAEKAKLPGSGPTPMELEAYQRAGIPTATMEAMK
ncbi:recombinase family protein [Mesorhizobium sp. DCY119]|uniref:recombinase family protein n=1 Tax=Mesorhizobium sp. DCY119 TaxID=2108445 RepID=UPI000E6BDE50|nr:recombinase family protein [Mesorhizobium sp. DCY119]RJG45470.1 hypothetical protein D3Y55_15200 [Mesorhizobium sp. DCY119]